MSEDFHKDTDTHPAIFDDVQDPKAELGRTIDFLRRRGQLSLRVDNSCYISIDNRPLINKYAKQIPGLANNTNFNQFITDQVRIVQFIGQLINGYSGKNNVTSINFGDHDTAQLDIMSLLTKRNIDYIGPEHIAFWVFKDNISRAQILPKMVYDISRATYVSLHYDRFNSEQNISDPLQFQKTVAEIMCTAKLITMYASQYLFELTDNEYKVYMSGARNYPINTELRKSPIFMAPKFTSLVRLFRSIENIDIRDLLEKGITEPGVIFSTK